MYKNIEYAGHRIQLNVDINTGSKIVDEASIITNTLSATIDDAAFLSLSGLSNDETIAKISDVQAQAEKRVDIMGTPSDSPLVEELIDLGFQFVS